MSHDLTPGRITDIKMHFVRNDFLAQVCVLNDMHRYLQHMCSRLHGAIASYVTQILAEGSGENPNSHGETKPSDVFHMESDVDCKGQIEIPKALGDMVEAVLGAVYLDSNLSLEKCWDVILRLIPDLKSKTYKKVKIDAVRLMYENCKIEDIKEIPPGKDRHVSSLKIKVRKRHIYTMFSYNFFPCTCALYNLK